MHELLEELADEAQQRRVTRTGFLVFAAVCVGMGMFTPVVTAIASIWLLGVGRNSAALPLAMLLGGAVAYGPLLLAIGVWVVRATRRQREWMPEVPPLPVLPGALLALAGMVVLSLAGSLPVLGPVAVLLEMLGLGIWAAHMAYGSGVQRYLLYGLALAVQFALLVVFATVSPMLIGVAVVPWLLVYLKTTWDTRSALARGDYDAAFAVSTGALCEVFGSPNVRARVALQANRDDAEELVMRTSIRTPAWFAIMAARLAPWRELRGDSEGAERAALAAMRDQPDQSAGFFARTVIALARNEDALPWAERMIEQATRGIRTRSDVGVLHAAYAAALARAGREREAKQELEALPSTMKRATDRAALHHFRGLALEALDEDATPEFAAACEDAGLWGDVARAHRSRDARPPEPSPT